MSLSRGALVFCGCGRGGGSAVFVVVVGGCCGGVGVDAVDASDIGGTGTCFLGVLHVCSTFSHVPTIVRLKHRGIAIKSCTRIQPVSLSRGRKTKTYSSATRLDETSSKRNRAHCCRFL